MNTFKRMIVRLSAATLSLAVIAAGTVTCFAADEAAAAGTKPIGTLESFDYISNIEYSEYITAHKDAANASESFGVDVAAFDATKSEKVETAVSDYPDAVVVRENGKVFWNITVPSDGFYNLKLDYTAIPVESSVIKFALGIDGFYPFSESENIVLSRVWADSDERIKDTQGNEIKPSAIQLNERQSKLLSDSNGYAQEAFRFFFEKGTHELSFEVFQNDLAINAIEFTAPSQLASYADALALWQKQGAKDASAPAQTVQAENLFRKSDKSITVTNDRASPMTYPSDSFNILYNCVGGGNWQATGQWIEWEIDVPETALYTIVLRFKQANKVNDVSSRALYIDGEIPFAEAKTIEFDYASGWQVKELGGKDGTPYKFYLTAGKHILRLEANLGVYSEALYTVSDALTELNNIYREILMITGSSPDTNRDYEFKKLIPATIENLNTMANKLRDIEKVIEDITGGGGQSTAVFKRLYTQLDSMYDKPATIAKRFATFKTNITALGTWINDERIQPLCIDYIMPSVAGNELPAAESNFFKVIGYYFAQFFGSFVMDYSVVGNLDNNADKEITVWIATGRDQADILRQMANDSFTPNSGISANIQLVNAGALLPATLAGIGPDVYLGMDEASPVNYALRNAVTDLRTFSDVDEVFTRFYDCAILPFRLDGGIYAIPETMTYPMMFYRKDILTDLGIKESDLKTWPSLLQKVLPELDMNYFEFGLTTSLKSYAMFLYQNNGAFYTEDHKASALNTPEALVAFQSMTNLYKDYGLELAFDFSNRFRSGEMPLAITEFSAYNQMSVFAPEIAGLWSMMPVPGVVDEDGNINNISVCTVTGAVILEESKDKDSAWEFLKWFTSTEAQTRYGTDLETVMGTGARYASANVEAMQNVQWDKSISTALQTQLKNVVGMPQIAGSYFTSRHYDFAFRDVVYNGDNPREALADASADITTEIQDKRAEFYGE